jgi:cytochrome d ubiquinol oxidase subunit I
LNENQKKEAAQHGPGNYMPNIELEYWAMRVMAYLGGLMLLVALWGGWLLWRKKLEQATWFQRTATAAVVVPFLACFGGWILTETGRQPWIVYGLQTTADAVSPSSTTTKVAFSLGVFLALYTILAIVDFWLMSRYARLDAAETADEIDTGTSALPVPSY